MGGFIEFGVLHEDGRVTDVRHVAHADITACPHVILDPEHYRADGTCRCDDEGHQEMASWGYSWDADQGRWI